MNITFHLNIVTFLGITLIIVIMTYFLTKARVFEHLTQQSDEAIQNLASLYNKDQLTIKDMNITNGLTTNSLTASSFNLLPKGIIVAWNGGPTPPKGWALCNGQNGTPNLSERFILATTNPTYFAARYRTGGSGSARLGVNNIPNHTHNIPIERTGGWNGTTSQGSDRGHNANTNTGNCNGCRGDAFTIWNPYYRLAYIMKL